MKVRKFETYSEYRDAQVAANRLKFGNIFAEEEELRRIAHHFQNVHNQGGKGLCHGVRNGFEVAFLRRLLPNVEITGTDISETAASLQHCIVWDMHDRKPEWVGAIDFMYSNSWDHSYDPATMFARWAECLSSAGRLYLPYTMLHTADAASEPSESDVFGCSLDELIEIVRSAFVVDEVLEIQPAVSRKYLLRKLSYLRMRRYRKLFGAPLTSRQVTVLVLRRRFVTQDSRAAIS